MFDNVFFPVWFAQAGVFVAQSCYPQGQNHGYCWRERVGETTLVSLLQNIYPIQSGRISIGQYDIAMISNESLRRFIGIVPQKWNCFQARCSLTSAWATCNPDMRRVLDIITQLGLKDFVDALPKGLDTIVSEQGTTFRVAKGSALPSRAPCTSSPKCLSSTRPPRRSTPFPNVS